MKTTFEHGLDVGLWFPHHNIRSKETPMRCDQIKMSKSSQWCRLCTAIFCHVDKQPMW